MFTSTLTTGLNPRILLLRESTSQILLRGAWIKSKLNLNVFLSQRSFIKYPVRERICLKKERQTKGACHSAFLAVTLNYFMNKYSKPHPKR